VSFDDFLALYIFFSFLFESVGALVSHTLFCRSLSVGKVFFFWYLHRWMGMSIMKGTR
jgi:hypothetical protein